MVGKNRDFSHLRAGLAGAAEQPAAETPAKRGRPTSETMAMNLRLPKALNTELIGDAAKASIAEGRNVTPQQIIVRILEAHYGQADRDRG
jgi:hypothetical protein